MDEVGLTRAIVEAARLAHRNIKNAQLASEANLALVPVVNLHLANCPCTLGRRQCTPQWRLRRACKRARTYPGAYKPKQKSGWKVRWERPENTLELQRKEMEIERRCSSWTQRGVGCKWRCSTHS